ncbi:packaged DNA stabilization gp4 family protein [Serratia plymuthica]|uniref:packaged DNA stabilization gp4 family protein n=1 Tax=Serratia plymuthica TaxID=82996 RepID=UPI0007EBB2B3|nr:packaged DNA stabilization gp4 family protein [Serratia plymuthica]ANJ92434.1 hypothetical protein ADP72_05325 [Serratia plymuthica]
MKLTNKGDLVIAALRKAALASNTSLTDVEPQSLEDGLSDLELMLSEWGLGDDKRGITLGFLFSEPGVDPAPEDLHGLPDFSLNAVITNLAIRMMPDYGIEPPMSLVLKASHGKEGLIKFLAKQRTPRLAYPNRMPVGSGNRLLNGPRYFHRKDNDDADDTTTANEG